MKKIYYIILVLLIGFSSCEDYLDLVPKHDLTDATAITDFNKARAAVSGVYSSFNSDNWHGGLYCNLATKSGFVDFTSGYDLDYNQTSSTGSGQWKSFYTSLNYANFAIKGILALPEASVPSEAAREALLGEAKCLRAWVHANLLWNFAHWWADDDDIYGILYRDEPIDMANIMKGRLTVGESYEKIFEDLDYAIEKMDDFTSPRYFSKQFAQVLKAKLLLYRGAYKNNNNTTDLQAALTLVNSVLTGSPGTFAMESDMQVMYDNSWDSKENLFAKYTENDNHQYGGSFYYSYSIGYAGNRPYVEGGTQTAGIKYGLDWFKEDPRWPIATGAARAPETWDESTVYTFTKLYRLGRYAGQQAGSPADKYTAYHFRYAELYLMKAELLARTGSSIGDAIAPINEMRSNRTNPVLEALNPASQEELMDLIFKEYWMELCLENGSEFFASLRFLKDGQPYIVAIKDGLPLNENAICWPIPNDEMVNNELMVQNIGLE